MVITIRYLRNGQSDWEQCELHPDDYFDLEPGEHPSQESVERHSHAVDYLGLNPEEVAVTELTVTTSDHSTRVITERLWNQGLNSLTEITDTFSDSPGWWLIYTFDNPLTPGAYEVQRFGRNKDGILILLSHMIYEPRADGEEHKHRIHAGHM